MAKKKRTKRPPAFLLETGDPVEFHCPLCRREIVCVAATPPFCSSDGHPPSARYVRMIPTYTQHYG